eukprot:6207645-Pleurochrysis_carterae.AAC.2
MFSIQDWFQGWEWDTGCSYQLTLGQVPNVEKVAGALRVVTSLFAHLEAFGMTLTSGHCLTRSLLLRRMAVRQESLQKPKQLLRLVRNNVGYTLHACTLNYAPDEYSLTFCNYHTF